MDAYKTAKEAFHADNPGSSIWNVNAVSLAALTSYILYAATSARLRLHPAIDYATMAFPLLLSVTSFSARPILFNVMILSVAAALRLTSPSPTPIRSIDGSLTNGEKHRKSKGQWLDESDSEEEPVQSPAQERPSHELSVQLPSTTLDPTSSSANRSSSPSLSLSPETDSSVSDSTGAGARSRRKRHSPTPSTHTHTAINILPTPELNGSHALSSSRHTYPSPTSPRTNGGGVGETSQKLPFLSVYRAHMMLMTVHCILAVDFPIFPRTLGKCEDFGTSLMDVGVGSFVFSLGIVSTRSFASPSAGVPPIVKVGRSLWKSAPVLALGMVRVLMVKGTEYPEHVTEYGVHWNFFFTLGLLPVLGTLLWPVRQKFMRWSTMGILVATVHEVALLRGGLQRWVLSAERVGLLGMNKEGVVSLAGYLAIYLLGLATGQHILRSAAPLKLKNPSTASATSRDKVQSHYEKRRTELALELFSYSVAWWSALALLRYLDFAVSRRLANLPYILWIAAYNTTFLFSYLLIEILLFPSSASNPVPPLLEAINSNGLVIFLIANLLTGLVNVSMRTMWTGDAMALVVLVGYSLVTCWLAWAMRRRRLKLG